MLLCMAVKKDSRVLIRSDIWVLPCFLQVFLRSTFNVTFPLNILLRRGSYCYSISLPFLELASALLQTQTLAFDQRDIISNPSRLYACLFYIPPAVAMYAWTPTHGKR